MDIEPYLVALSAIGATATGGALVLRQLRLWSRQRQEYKLRRHIFDQTRSVKRGSRGNT